jgi:putative transposase
MTTTFPRRPPRLQRIFEELAPPIYFVTFCTDYRKPILTNHHVFCGFVRFAEVAANEHGVSVGVFVLMPDHIHLFVQGFVKQSLGAWVGLLKRSLSKALLARGVRRPHWQPNGFFDHILRSTESYAEKCDYVRQNPVRKGLVLQADDWPFQGEIRRLTVR